MILQNLIKITSNLNIDDPDKKKISYSQYSKWAKCPLSWKLSYIDKIKIQKPSIALVFGTSFHETLQYYLKLAFDETVKKADSINLRDLLKENMINNYSSDLINNNNVHFSTPEEMAEHLEDGTAILEFIKKNRTIYFSTRGIELVGIELPLFIQASKANKNVMYLAYLDLVLYDKDLDQIIIYDFKTSKKGWTDNDKKDKVKTSQVILYKKYFSELLGFPEDRIKVVFFIVRRKIYENPDNPYMKTKRVQEFIPANGSKTINDVTRGIDSFVSACFNADGSYNTTGNYPAITGVEQVNCKFCDYKERFDLCPKENRVTAKIKK